MLPAVLRSRDGFRVDNVEVHDLTLHLPQFSLAVKSFLSVILHVSYSSGWGIFVLSKNELIM